MRRPENKIIALFCRVLFLASIGGIYAESESAPEIEPISAPEFTAQFPAPVREGYFRLQWTIESRPESRPRFRLEEAGRLDFAEVRVRYEGPDLASFVSGLPDGEYHYRVGLLVEPGAGPLWSEPITVVVEHHSLGRALLWLGIGGAVFLATVLLILAGNARAEPSRAEP